MSLGFTAKRVNRFAKKSQFSRKPKFFPKNSLAKNAKFFEYFDLIYFAEMLKNKKAKSLGGKMRKNYGKEIINYGIIKLLRAEISTSFLSQLIVAVMVFVDFFGKIIFWRNIASFSHFLLYSFSRKNAKFLEKVFEIRTKIFAFFGVSVRALETLIESKICRPISQILGNKSVRIKKRMDEKCITQLHSF